MPELVSIAVASIGAIGACVAAFISHTTQRNTKPISNGFAADTTRRLDRIEGLITGHIQAHADHDVARKG